MENNRVKPAAEVYYVHEQYRKFIVEQSDPANNSDDSDRHVWRQRDDCLNAVPQLSKPRQRALKAPRLDSLYFYRTAKRIFIFVVGITVLLTGLAMTVLPGPAVLVIPLGLAILATEFAWAGLWLRKYKDTSTSIFSAMRAWLTGKPPFEATARIVCAECGKKIHLKGGKCPQCGNPATVVRVVPKPAN